MSTEKTIKLNKVEIQSGSNRVRYAENLILQLPKDHEGRNSWLLNYGVSAVAIDLRHSRNLKFDLKTQSVKLKRIIMATKTRNEKKYSAKFRGASSIGYEKGRVYILRWSSFVHNAICRLDGTGACEYSSLENFLDNWEDIKEIS